MGPWPSSKRAVDYSTHLAQDADANDDTRGRDARGNAAAWPFSKRARERALASFVTSIGRVIDNRGNECDRRQWIGYR